LRSKKPVQLSAEVEGAEVYSGAGHPEGVPKRGRPGRGRRLKGNRGRAGRWPLKNRQTSA
jgi:hypothetical protein